jgi:hypothetical protein
MMLLVDCYYVLFSLYFFICVDGALLQTKFIDEIGCVNPHLNTVSINLSVLFLELVNNYSLCVSNVPRFDVDGATICQKFHFYSIIDQVPSKNDNPFISRSLMGKSYHSQRIFLFACYYKL